MLLSSRHETGMSVTDRPMICYGGKKDSLQTSRFQSLGYDKDEWQGFSQYISDMISERNVELCNNSGNNHSKLLIIYSAK
jgi:hypothetical protein